MLASAGMLNSCQQDEVVDEVPASKGVTIRASLPDDAQSRVSLGETIGNYTKLCWEKDDEIKVTIGGVEYTFTTTDSGKTTATFTCEELPSEHKLPQGSYTFTCGSAPTQNQNGTGSGIQMQATCTVGDMDGRTWDNVSLQFSAAVALVEISLPTDFTATKVTMYDANTGECLATTVNRTFTDKIYFSVSPNSSLNRKPVILAENGTNARFVELTTSKPMLAAKLYRMNMNTEMTKTSTVSTVDDSNMKYFTLAGTTYMCGYGDSNSKIPDSYFYTIESLPTNVIKMFGVTTIGDKAFRDCGRLNVTFPATISLIDTSAFQFCNTNEGGTTFTFLGTQPPELKSSALGAAQVPDQINIPAGSINNYINGVGWGDYLKFIPGYSEN